MANISRSGPRGWSIGGALVVGGFTLAIPLAIAADDGVFGKALLAALAPAVLVVYLAVRGARIGFAADETGVVVRNFWRTTRLGWTDVAELVTGPASTAWQTGAGHLALIVVAKSGRRVIATGTITRHTRSEQLSLELAPVFALAAQHDVRWQWRDLTPDQLAEIQRKVEAIGRIASIARRIQ